MKPLGGAAGSRGVSMAKLGVARPAAHEPAGRKAAQATAQPERGDAPFAGTERRAAGAAAADSATAPGIAGGYRRVFACATGSTDAPDEERTP